MTVEDHEKEAGGRDDLGLMARRWMRWVWEWTRALVLALIVLVAVRAFLVDAFKIPSASMEGTLLVGDFLFVNRLAYGAELPGGGASIPAMVEPERWDVVVFRPPHDPDRSYVKRLVGLPGDTLSMRNKVLFINGEPQEEQYTQHRDRRGDAAHPRMLWQRRHLADGRSRRSYRPTRDNWGPLLVPQDQYFMLGDNRDNSEDSRYWGFVPRDSFTGRPWRVYFSVIHPGMGPGPWFRQVRWDRIGGRIE
jgi:signal peptidase I